MILSFHLYFFLTIPGEGAIPDEDDNDDVIEVGTTGGNESDLEEPKEDERLPKPDWSEPEPIRAEEHHSGTNRYVYFVCNRLGDGWSRLPHAVPGNIVASRQITKLLTGDLDAVISSYPPFPGKTETHYLRSLIARISGCTQISPTGFFVFDDEGAENDDEEDEIRDSYNVNLSFEGTPVRHLKESYGQNWVHHSKYILPQGRCTWWSGAEKYREDFDEEEVYCDAIYYFIDYKRKFP